jgi:hypothetical protein
MMKRAILLAGLLAISATAAPAQSVLRVDPNRPTDLIAADLGIPEAVFVECFRNVNPDPDHDPSGATQRANKAILLPCLQKANPEITNDRLDTVMDHYRPEGAIRG